MLTLLLAAAACAASGVKCDGFGGSVPYVANETATPPVLGFTPAGDGVVAVCAREPGSSTVGYIHLLNASTGGLRQVTKAVCDFSMLVYFPVMMNGQYLVSVVSLASLQNAIVFLPLKGGPALTKLTGARASCAGSNGESLVAVGGWIYSDKKRRDIMQVYDNQGSLQQTFDFEESSYAVAVSKLIGNSSSSDYYVAVAYYHQPLTVYDSNGDVVASYNFAGLIKGMKFRDEDNSLVVVAEYAGTIVFDIETGANTTYPRPGMLTVDSVAFNADGSKMISYMRDRWGGGTPHVLFRDLSTGAGRVLCTMDGDAKWTWGASVATDGQGRSVVLTYSQVNDSTPKWVSVFDVPNETKAPATPAPWTPMPPRTWAPIPTWTPFPTNAPSDSSAPVGAIVGGVLGGVALLVAAGVGFWLWKKRQGAPETDGELVRTGQNYHTIPAGAASVNH